MILVFGDVRICFPEPENKPSTLHRLDCGWNPSHNYNLCAVLQSCMMAGVFEPMKTMVRGPLSQVYLALLIAEP